MIRKLSFREVKQLVHLGSSKLAREMKPELSDCKVRRDRGRASVKSTHPDSKMHGLPVH